MKTDFLKKRAEDFAKMAEISILEKKWNLAAFFFEQSSQLYLKHCIFKRLKDYPKIHDLEELLEIMGKVYKKEISKFKKENAAEISALNQAYISSRYLPVEFSKEQIEKMREFHKKLISLLKKLCP